MNLKFSVDPNPRSSIYRRKKEEEEKGFAFILLFPEEAAAAQVTTTVFHVLVSSRTKSSHFWWELVHCVFLAVSFTFKLSCFFMNTFEFGYNLSVENTRVSNCNPAFPIIR